MKDALVRDKEALKAIQEAEEAERSFRPEDLRPASPEIAREIEEGLVSVARARLDEPRTISLRITRRDYALLRAKAREKGANVSTLIRMLIRDFVEGKIEMKV